MKRIHPAIGLAHRVKISNVWLLTTPSGARILFDTGHWVERPALRLQLWRAGVRGPGDLDAVVLTHRHSDHTGNAAWLRRTFDAPICCHEADASYLTGEASPPALARPETVWWARMLCHVEDRLPARTIVDEVFTEGAWRHGLYVHHTPGHTEGSVVLHHASSGGLFSGDSIVAGVAMARWMERLRYAREGFSEDIERSVDAVRRFLQEIPPTEALCAGHGPGITRGVEAKLAALLEGRAPRPKLRVLR